MVRAKEDRDTLTLTTGGITLLGIILSIGVTVGFGLNVEWWLRLVLGVATSVVLVLVVKVATRAGHGPLARLARWTINEPQPPYRDGG